MNKIMLIVENRELKKQLIEALDALESLHDWQNGPPLIQEEK